MIVGIVTCVRSNDGEECCIVNVEHDADTAGAGAAADRHDQTGVVACLTDQCEHVHRTCNTIACVTRVVRSVHEHEHDVGDDDNDSGRRAAEQGR
jgi:hypothetical protein